MSSLQRTKTLPEFIAESPIGGIPTQLKAFSELGMSSLTEADKGSAMRVPVLDTHPEYIDQDDLGITAIDLSSGKLRVVPVHPSHETMQVISVDASSVKIAEDSRGSIVAVRGAVVRRVGDTISSQIFGPFLFYVTEENKDSVYGALRSSLFGEDAEVRAPNLEQMPKRICNLLDKWLQRHAARSFHNSIVLFDGSLTAGTVDSPFRVLENIVQTALENGSSILAFSKMTRLRIWGVKITDLHDGFPFPYLLPVGPYISGSMKLRCLGDVYVARLSPWFYSYRVDINNQNTVSHSEVVGRLLSSDAMVYGYPETLLLAHVLCTFNKVDVIGLQLFLSQNLGVPITGEENIRRSLFMPFDQG